MGNSPGFENFLTHSSADSFLIAAYRGGMPEVIRSNKYAQLYLFKYGRK